mgnify:CR=1 FL=1
MDNNVADVGAESPSVPQMGTKLRIDFLMNRHEVGACPDGSPHVCTVGYHRRFPAFSLTVDFGAIEPGLLSEVFDNIDLVFFKTQQGDRYAYLRKFPFAQETR